MPRRDEDWTGIYQHGAGWRAVVSQGRGRPPIVRHFSKDTTLHEMQEWRADVRAAYRVHRKQRATAGTFEADAQRYLRAVTGLATFTDRKREIAVWIDVFQQRRRDTIRPADIREVRDRWAREPRGQDDAGKPLPPLGPGTINKRLRALSNVWTVLDGRRAPNPVRDVDELTEPELTPRALTYDTIATIIAAMPDRGRATKGKTVPTISKSKVRVRCMAYSQITPKQLAQLTRAHLDLTRGRLRLPARAKGRGAAAVWVPLSPAAIEAFTDFDRHDLYGPFSQRSLRKSWARAIATAQLPPARPYDLRHTYASAVYRATRSRDAVQQLLQHASWTTSERYALEAEADVLDAHAEMVGRHIGTTGTGAQQKTLEKGERSDQAGAGRERRSGKRNAKKS